MRGRRPWEEHKSDALYSFTSEGIQVGRVEICPLGGEQNSVSQTRLRRRSPFNHVGMRGNPLFPKLHAEP
jgi:hypothetical protein